AVGELAGDFGAVFLNQAVDKAGEQGLVTVFCLPVLVALVDGGLCLGEVAQHAQVIVHHGEDPVQAVGLAGCLVQPGLGGGHVPGVGAPDAGRVLGGVGVPPRRVLTLPRPVHCIHVGLDVFRSGVTGGLLANDVGHGTILVALVVVVARQDLVANAGHQLGDELWRIGQRWAMGGL